MAVTDWEPATEAETAMRDALHAGDQELYFRILAGTELFLPVSGQALAGAAPMGWGTWTTGGRTHVLAFTSAAAMHACLGSSAGPYRRSRYADLAVEWPNHEWWLAVNPGLPVEGYLPAWFVSQLSRGDVRLPGRAPVVRSQRESDQPPVRGAPGGPADVEPTADLSAGWSQPRPASSVTAPPAGGGIRPATGASLTDERGRPVVPPGGGPRTTTAGPPEQGRPAFPEPGTVPAATNGGWPAVPRRRLLGEESAGPANGRTSFFEPSSARGATRSPRDNPLRSGERAAPPTRPGMGGQPFPRRRPAPNQPGEDEATRAFRMTDPPARSGPGNGASPAGHSPDPLAEEPTRAFRVEPPGGEPTRAFHVGPVADEATRAFRTPPPAAEATQALPRRQPTPDGSPGARQPRPPTDPFAVPPAAPTDPFAVPPAAPTAPAGPARGEAEEVPPSVAEPVSAPPVSRRGFMPIVIEGVILESRDLPVAPAPAPSAAQGSLFVPPAASAPPVVPPPAAAPFVPPAAPVPPPVPPSAAVPTATPVPPAGGPGAGDTVNVNGTGGPFGAPARPPASGPVHPPPASPSPAAPPPAARPRPAPDDLWTPAAERAASKARPEVAAAPPDVAPPPASALTVHPPAPAADTPVTRPAGGAQAWTAPPGDAVPADSAPAAPTPTGDAAPTPTAGGPVRTAAGTAPKATAPGADRADPRSTPVDLWTPAAERAAQTSPAAPVTELPTTTVPAATAGPSAPAGPTATAVPTASAVPTSPAAPGPAGDPAPFGSAPPGSPSSTAGADVAPPVDEAFLPANEVEENLLDAVGVGSTDGFLSTLLLARVLLPVNPDSVAGSRPGEPGFQWRTGTTDGETYVVVYTSPERLAEHDVLPVETIEVRFVQLIRRWPDPSWAFAVNPGTPVGAKLPGEQIVALASWAAEVGLGDEADVEPVAAAEAPAERTRYAPPVTDPSRPVVMQKAVAPSQLAYYLERGYDRVSGFVHRAGELAHLTTPAELHDALGLGYPDSPFARDAEATYVLRWPAYRPSLYRIPYGGQNEAAMRAMEGWVIERAPFRGNGFAPGESSDVVAEFKVDSARLPHGAQLWRIGTEGTERVIAILDTDALVWRQVGQE
ncbi:hypothetical protein TPA0907_49960 [Micromonospora humidisoli]|nr:hypothetical protein TPA0907_49960 [Micromonospora sp. AKA109]